MLRRDNHTNLQFPHLPMHPPSYYPPLLPNIQQRLTDLENKLTAMESTTTKDDGEFGSHPRAFQQDTELLAQEEKPLEKLLKKSQS